MAKDLTQSGIDRQNILNNAQAIEIINSKLSLNGLLFNDEYKFTTKMVMDFYGISRATVSRYVSNNQDELLHNGYQILKGQKLKEFKELFAPLIVPNEDNEEQSITDDTLSNQNNDIQNVKRIKALAGSTKYINQRDEEFLIAITREPQYRKEFTNALNLYLDMGPMKYSIYTDAIYSTIFIENTKEYKAILKLEAKENLRDTMYAEVLKLIAQFEIGIADEMQEKATELGRKLKPSELNLLIDDFSKKRFWIPQIEDARAKMASRDYGLRNIIHQRLQNYIGALTKEDYNRYLGERSKNLIERVLENPDLIDVFKRLKDR